MANGKCCSKTDCTVDGIAYYRVLPVDWVKLGNVEEMRVFHHYHWWDGVNRSSDRCVWVLAGSITKQNVIVA